MLQLSIIIVSYNTKDLTLQCIQSLKDNYQDELEKGEFEIIVVDNASIDGTMPEISNFKSQISNLKIFFNEKNVGFGKGNNIGAKYAKGKYLLFLNSDTKVASGLPEMISYLSTHEDVGILGARLYNPDGSKQPSVGKFFTLLHIFLMLLGAERIGFLRTSPKSITDVEWVSGAAMMVKNSLFDKLGGFDEHFFMYVEDMELCYRVRRSNFRVVFYPDTHITHMQQGSSNRSFAIIHIYRGLLYFYKKHKNYIQYMVVKMLLITKAILAIMIGIGIGNAYLKSTYRKALTVIL